MKNIKLIVLALFSALLFVLTSCSPMETYSETSFMGIEVISAEKLSQLETSNTPIFDPEGAGLLFGGNPVPYYANENTYLLPVDIASESWDDNRLTSENGGKLYILTDDGLSAESKANTVADSKKFTLVHIINGEFNKYSIVFTGLPIMTVDTKEPPSNPDNPIDEENVGCRLTMYEPSSVAGTPVYQSSDAYLHHRGGSTVDAGYLKKGLRINLRYTDVNGEEQNNHLSFCGLRTEDDWILVPLYTEETKVREKFSIDTWAMFGLEENDYDMDNGTRMEYIELIINGEYWGMFGLLEPIDGKQLNMVDGDVLVKIHSWTKPKAKILRTLGNTELYIDYTVALAEQETMSIKYPKAKDITQAAWDPMAMFMEGVYESTAKVMLNKIGSWIDMENAVDHWLFTNFICAGDNVWKNLYISFKKDADIFKIYLTPWDFDLTYGLTWDGDAYLHFRYNDSVVDDIYNFEYSKRVLEVYEGADDYCYTRWTTLREDVLNEDNIVKRIDDIQAFMLSTGAYVRDLEKWPEGGHTTDLSYMKEIIHKRLEYMDQYIESRFGPKNQ
ncbi:MAG: CotH kinase family protein [Clostridia bacterium]|nr:CotH kinase family protein [Clostridia bacterium]